MGEPKHCKKVSMFLTELEKVPNVPSIQNRTYTMFLEFLPWLTKSAEEIFYLIIGKTETITKIDKI